MMDFYVERAIKLLKLEGVTVVRATWDTETHSVFLYASHNPLAMSVSEVSSVTRDGAVDTCKKYNIDLEIL